MQSNFRLAVAILGAAAMATPLHACIFKSDADLAAWYAQYKKEQAALVRPVALEASAIVIAKAQRWTDKNGWETEFRITRVLKGQATVDSVVKYRSSLSVGGTPCTPAKDTFRDTTVSPGTEYLLYVKGGKLLRVAQTGERRGISLSEELELVSLTMVSDK